MPHLVLRYLSAVLLALVAAAASAAQPPVLLKFKGAIGVDPLTATNGVDVLNVVRGINPGGRAWVIRKFDATVYTDASIVVQGKGLLFSSGEVIATRGPVAQVAATLACGPADATATKFTSDSAPLNAAGNFKIRGSLRDGFGNVATLPPSCENPQLLIRAFGAAGPGGWFAAGILESDDED
jgi:hypothetical protein